MTKPGQIAPERLQPIAGCQSRFDIFTAEGDYVGIFEPVPNPGLPLSVAVYDNLIYLSVTGAERGRQDVVIVDANSNQVVDRISSANVYVHQSAKDSHGDIYAASVYPEHGGESRGIEGPSFRRWSRR